MGLSVTVRLADSVGPRSAYRIYAPEGVAGTKFAFNAVHVVFEDHNATILRAVHDKPISRVKPYCVAVSRLNGSSWIPRT